MHFSICAHNACGRKRDLPMRRHILRQDYNTDPRCVYSQEHAPASFHIVFVEPLQ